MAKFRVTVYDPVLLVAQMLACQAGFYLFAGVAAALLGALLGAPASATLSTLFDANALRTDTAQAWIAATAFVIGAAGGAVLLLALVGRSKQCFDFTATLHGFHLLACIAYAGWPRSVFWWAINVTTLILMAVLGEYLCMRRELLPITLAGQDLSRAGTSGPRAGAARRVGAAPATGNHAEEHEMVDLRPRGDGEP